MSKGVSVATLREGLVSSPKGLFVFDTGGSAQFEDPDQERAVAVEQLVVRQLNNPRVQLGVVLPSRPWRRSRSLVLWGRMIRCRGAPRG